MTYARQILEGSNPPFD